MHKKQRISANRLLAAGLCVGLSSLSSLAQVSVRQVRVLGSKEVVEVEVESSDRIVPQTQVLSNPDRLVIDFPNSRPSDQVRSQSVDRGEVKDVRVGLFQSNPPVTRVVLDLKSARSYQIFPSGRTVMIKVIGGSPNTTAQIQEAAQPLPQRPGLVTTNYTTRAEPLHIDEIPVAAPKTALEVSYKNGLLGIVANKAITVGSALCHSAEDGSRYRDSRRGGTRQSRHRVRPSSCAGSGGAVAQRLKV